MNGVCPVAGNGLVVFSCDLSMTFWSRDSSKKFVMKVVIRTFYVSIRSTMNLHCQLNMIALIKCTELHKCPRTRSPGRLSFVLLVFNALRYMLV